VNKPIPARDWMAYCAKVYADNKELIDSVLREELTWHIKQQQQPITPITPIKTAPKVCK
jgi:hypothetical protein